MPKITINKFHVYIGDVFLLNYYGILTFFQVAKTTENYVYLVELATKPHEIGIVIDDKVRTSKHPYFVTKNNLRSKTTYKVMPIIHNFEPVLPIQITEDSNIYKEVYKFVDYPQPGTFYAYYIEDWRGCCWVSEEVDSEPNA